MTMKFYKYVPQKRIDILQNRLIRFTQPNAMNDPFEAKPHFYELGPKAFARNYAEAIRKFSYRVWVDYCRALGNDPERFELAKKVENDPDYAEQLYTNLHKQTPQALVPNLRERFYKLHNTAGILSLSEILDNLLMWAHYAEAHTGFVLVLDGSHDFFKGSVSLPGFAKPERVEYRLERPRMTIEKTSEEAALQEIFFVKGLDWEYEKEWRYLKNLTDAQKKIVVTNGHDVHLFRLPPKCIKGVVLGCYSSEELKNKIVELCRDDPEFGHLRIQQALTSETRYSVTIKTVEA